MVAEGVRCVAAHKDARACSQNTAEKLQCALTADSVMEYRTNLFKKRSTRNGGIAGRAGTFRSRTRRSRHKSWSRNGSRLAESRISRDHRIRVNKVQPKILRQQTTTVNESNTSGDGAKVRAAWIALVFNAAAESDNVGEDEGLITGATGSCCGKGCGPCCEDGDRTDEAATTAVGKCDTNKLVLGRVLEPAGKGGEGVVEGDGDDANSTAVCAGP